MSENSDWSDPVKKKATYDVNNRKTVSLSGASLYPTDAELLQAITEYLGCSKSEAVRTCIRTTAAALPLPGKAKRKRGLQHTP